MLENYLELFIRRSIPISIHTYKLYRLKKFINPTILYVCNLNRLKIVQKEGFETSHTAFNLIRIVDAAAQLCELANAS